jgi:hypothetical protein
MHKKRAAISMLLNWLKQDDISLDIEYLIQHMKLVFATDSQMFDIVMPRIIVRPDTVVQYIQNNVIDYDNVAAKSLMRNPIMESMRFVDRTYIHPRLLYKFVTTYRPPSVFSIRSWRSFAVTIMCAYGNNDFQYVDWYPLVNWILTSE